jgi:O-antigen biosynthesis protein WbqP
MSLVGPRPLIGEEVDMHRVRTAHGVYRVRPGMTGLAQIHGRDRLADGEKAAYDIRYVTNLSLREDLRIVAKSIGCVLSGENAK